MSSKFFHFREINYNSDNQSTFLVPLASTKKDRFRFSIKLASDCKAWVFMLLRLDSENLSTLQQFFRILFSYGNVSSNTSDECTLCPIEIEFSHKAVEKWFHSASMVRRLKSHPQKRTKWKWMWWQGCGGKPVLRSLILLLLPLIFDGGKRATRIFSELF